MRIQLMTAAAVVLLSAAGATARRVRRGWSGQSRLPQKAEERRRPLSAECAWVLHDHKATAGRSDLLSGKLITAPLPALSIPPLPEDEALGAAIGDDLRGVEVSLRVRGHVVNDVEIARLRPPHADRSDRRHRRTIKDDDTHRP